jgi:hypothetical protein
MNFGPPSDLTKNHDEKLAFEDPDLNPVYEKESISEGILDNTWNWNLDNLNLTTVLESQRINEPKWKAEKEIIDIPSTDELSQSLIQNEDLYEEDYIPREENQPAEQIIDEIGSNQGEIQHEEVNDEQSKFITLAIIDQQGNIEPPSKEQKILENFNQQNEELVNPEHVHEEFAIHENPEVDNYGTPPPYMTQSSVPNYGSHSKYKHKDELINKTDVLGPKSPSNHTVLEE